MSDRRTAEQRRGSHLSVLPPGTAAAPAAPANAVAAIVTVPANAAARAAGHEQLTRRERQVRGLMELGLPDKVIAERLVLSIKTVEKHAGAVLRKTGARNRTELAALASRARLRQAAR